MTAQPVSNGGVRPGAGRPVGSRGRRQKLIDDYIAALGGIDRVTALVMVEIERCVDMTLLAEGMRAKALRGEEIEIGELVRLEGALSRVLRSLNIPPPNAAAAVPNIHDLAAMRAAERANPQPAEGDD